MLVAPRISPRSPGIRTTKRVARKLLTFGLVASGKKPIGPRELPRTSRKVYIRCAIGILTCRGSVEIKINGAESGAIRLEATSCHFVRKERRNSMGLLTPE